MLFCKLCLSMTWKKARSKVPNNESGTEDGALQRISENMYPRLLNHILDTLHTPKRVDLGCTTNSYKEGCKHNYNCYKDRVKGNTQTLFCTIDYVCDPSLYFATHSISQEQLFWQIGRERTLDLWDLIQKTLDRDLRKWRPVHAGLPCGICDQNLGGRYHLLQGMS